MKALFKSISKNPVFQDVMKIQELMSIEETANGQVHRGIGSFGYYATNTIPVNGVFGEISYLGRLRTNKGIKVVYKRLGPIWVDNLNNPVDEYEIKVYIPEQADPLFWAC